MQKFIVDYNGVNLVGDIIGSRENLSTLFLHGAGTADRTRLLGIREGLYKEGISSCSFDFIGHGETGGSLLESSLKERTEQAVEVVRYLDLKQPLVIVAASMSGYTAIRLTEFFKVSSLVFLAPGVYAREAYEVSFGDGFSSIIRQDKSWEKSDAFELLGMFTGKLLLFTAEHDEVVPNEITDKLYDSAVNALSKEKVELAGAGHPVGQFLRENKEGLKLVNKTIVDFLDN